MGGVASASSQIIASIRAGTWTTLPAASFTATWSPTAFMVTGVPFTAAKSSNPDRAHRIECLAARVSDT